MAQKTLERLQAENAEIKQNVETATVKGELEPSKRPPTGGWAVRVSDCPHMIESKAFREESSTRMDDVLVMRSSVESHDGSRRHSEMGLDMTQPRSTPPCPGFGKAKCYQQTLDKKDMILGCSRFPQCRREVRVPPTTESPASLSVPSCSAAQPPEIQAT